MGAMKQLLQEELDLRAAAVAILCNVGAIKECRRHGGTYFAGKGNLVRAYMRAILWFPKEK